MCVRIWRGVSAAGGLNHLDEKSACRRSAAVRLVPTSRLGGTDVAQAEKIAPDFSPMELSRARSLLLGSFNR
jgi:hypothetical protein